MPCRIKFLFICRYTLLICYQIKQRKKDEFEEISLYDAILKVEDIMDGE